MYENVVMKLRRSCPVTFLVQSSTIWVGSSAAKNRIWNTITDVKTTAKLSALKIIVLIEQT